MGAHRVNADDVKCLVIRYTVAVTRSPHLRGVIGAAVIGGAAVGGAVGAAAEPFLG